MMMMMMMIIICLKTDIDFKLSLVTSTSCALLGTVGWGRRLKCSFLSSHFTEWMVGGTRPYKTSHSWDRKEQEPRRTRGSGVAGDGPIVQATTGNHSTPEQITGGAGGCSTSQLGFGFLPPLHSIPRPALALLPRHEQIIFWQKHVC